MGRCLCLLLWENKNANVKAHTKLHFSSHKIKLALKQTIAMQNRGSYFSSKVKWYLRKATQPLWLRTSSLDTPRPISKQFMLQREPDVPKHVSFLFRCTVLSSPHSSIKYTHSPLLTLCRCSKKSVILTLEQ